MTGRAKPPRRPKWIALLWGLGLLGALDLVALRAGWLVHSHWVLAGIAGLLILACVVEVIMSGRRLLQRRGSRLASAASLLAGLGALVFVGAGLLNWMLSLQGYVILSQGDVVPLFAGSHLTSFEAGPLANPHEMEIMAELGEVEFEAKNGRAVAATSVLVLKDVAGKVHRLQLSSKGPATHGVLRFHQGAFGFAPHIKIARAGKVLFERAVPFLTRHDENQGLEFEGAFDVAEHNLDVRGRVALDSLDERLRGHPTLMLEVQHNKVPVGAGTLRPGHAAKMNDGYEVGFVGLRKWSEIVVSRKTYTGAVIAGAIGLLVGLVLGMVARWT